MAAKRRPKVTIEQYDRVLQLRRARVPSTVICQIVGLDADEIGDLITKGLPARKGKHPAQRAISAVLIEDVAEGVSLAREWAGEIAGASRQTIHERVKTALAAARIERLLISAWSAQIDHEVKIARDEGRDLEIGNLLAGKGLLECLRTLAKTRDLAGDVRAPLEVYRGRLVEDGTDVETDGGVPAIDPSLYGDLLELDEDGLEHYSLTGEMPPPAQLELPAGPGEE